MIGTVDDALRALRAGQVVAVPTDTVYGVAATLPHASSTIAATRDPRPRPLLSLNTFNYYDPRLKPADAPETAFVVERAMLRVVGQRGDDTGLALARGPFARFIEKLANGSRGSQYRFERWFGSFIGGFEEFDVVLAAVKHAEKSRPGHLARSMARPDAALPGEAAVADPTGLHVTSDVGHEAAVIDQDAAGLLPSARSYRRTVTWFRSLS